MPRESAQHLIPRAWASGRLARYKWSITLVAIQSAVCEIVRLRPVLPRCVTSSNQLQINLISFLLLRFYEETRGSSTCLPSSSKFVNLVQNSGTAERTIDRSESRSSPWPRSTCYDLPHSAIPSHDPNSSRMQRAKLHAFRVWLSSCDRSLPKRTACPNSLIHARLETRFKPKSTATHRNATIGSGTPPAQRRHLPVNNDMLPCQVDRVCLRPCTRPHRW